MLVRKFFLFLFMAAGLTTAIAQQGQKNIVLEDIWQRGTFSIASVPGFNAMQDGERYTRLSDSAGVQSLRSYFLKDGQPDSMLWTNAQGAARISEYVLSSNEQQILLFANGENIYRRSVLYNVSLYDRRSGKTTSIGNGKILHATLSPDGKKIAYVQNNNLYLYDVSTGQTKAVTTDGQRNQIINGNCDWVYEEEFEFTRAYEWSADSRFIAYYKFDESRVPTFTMTIYDSLYPTPYTYKYPKAGEPNSVVSIHAYEVASGVSKVLRRTNTDDSIEYIPRIRWSPVAPDVLIYTLNRHQNKLDLVLASATTGSSNVVYTERNKRFVDINDNFYWMKDGQSFILSSDKNGWTHLWRYDLKRKKLTDLTPGNFDVEGITTVDEAQNLLYFTAAKTSATRRELYVTDFRGKGSAQVTSGDGYHEITPAGTRYFLDKFSSLGVPPVYRLIDAGGEVVRILEDNARLRQKMQEYRLGSIQMTRIATDSDEVLNGWMIFPPDFDKNKKYPVLMYQYSGPGSQQVLDRFPTGDFFWHQMLAQKGYIVACFDGTGTGYRGEDFRKKTYLELGNLESNDQIMAARALARRPYIDSSRIGIWGWSYGGFMSATCLMKAPAVFKAAISVAPVTNWRFYDNIYTERYMRTPQENPEGYDNNAPDHMAAGLSGNLLLIHGTGDDNVHVQNSMSLINALIRADKQFDSEMYPNRHHGISGGNTRLQLYRRMTNFILEQL